MSDDRVTPGDGDPEPRGRYDVPTEGLYCPDCGWYNVTMADRPVAAFLCGEEDCNGYAWREGHGPVDWGAVLTEREREENSNVGLDAPAEKLPALDHGYTDDDAITAEGGPTDTDADAGDAETDEEPAADETPPPPPPDDSESEAGGTPPVDPNTVTDELDALDEAAVVEDTDGWYDEELVDE